MHWLRSGTLLQSFDEPFHPWVSEVDSSIYEIKIVCFLKKGYRVDKNQNQNGKVVTKEKKANTCNVDPDETSHLDLRCLQNLFLWSVELKGITFNSFPASGNFCCLLITFANSLDPDQAQKNIGPDLDPKYLTLMEFLKDFFLKN